ncbi:MAG TPA: cellulose biosynthesis cyclic di-GMP-binding regulatory protein BcsB, partial [Acidobacteriaceae bacterium]|nr:cellulose biosynthesis cyclic di-GMP-binding regulatory protein BcsB [Acidobacteriaceae bacterium]
DEALAMILYSRADAWLGLDQLHEADRPVRSLLRILGLSVRGFTQGFGSAKQAGMESDADRPLAGIALLMIVLALSGYARGLSAQTPSAAENARASAGSSAVVPAVQDFHSITTLGELGVPGSITLRGAGASYSVHLLMPRNKTIVMGILKLRYRFSPGLIPELSQLNVRLNGTLAQTIPMNGPEVPDGPGGLLEQDVILPPELLVHKNTLSFEFLGHYAKQCEDPSNSTLWATIDASSMIEVGGSTMPLINDLKMLPWPFYDPGAELGGNAGADRNEPVVFVFLSPPSAKAMQAAALIASWLGVLHGSHAVRFLVSIGQINAGNAIVIAEDRSKIPPALGISGSRGGTASMVSNPSDPRGTLLVIAGSSGDDLMAAAGALALHGDIWQGSQVSVGGFLPAASRVPDDAPLWLSTETRGGAAQPEDLQNDGSGQASMYMRLPPDLAFGQRRNLGLHLSYRYNGIPLGADSTLQVYVNGAFVSSTPLPHTDHASSVIDTVVPVPVVDLRPFSNTITFQFAFRRARNGGCSSEPPMNLQGTILKDTYLDISGIEHAAVLPNLELFANAGYPFTRSADLAQTAVVLPDQPSPAELELFLTLMGHFGAQAGYPALRVTVTDAAGMTADGGRDYLVLGTSASAQPALKVLGGAVPVEVSGDTLAIHDTQRVFDAAGWWRGNWFGRGESGQLTAQGGLPDGLLEGIEWPVGSRRSVVAVIPRDDAAIANFVPAFLAKSQTGEIAQSVSVLRGADFSSYRMGGGRYRVGRISLLGYLSAIFEDAPWLIGVVTVIFCFLMAALMQAMLRRHARERLQGGDE